MTTTQENRTFEAITSGSSGVKEALRRFVKKMENTKWVLCLSCNQEWNKLRPCRYLDGNNYAVFIDVCVECAESLYGIEYAASVFPMPGVVVEKKFIGPPKYKEGKLLCNLTAKVSYEGMIFSVIRLEGGSISFQQAGQQKERRADNIFAAWSMIAHEIMTPDLSVKQTPKGVRGSGHRGYDWGQE